MDRHYSYLCCDVRALSVFAEPCWSCGQYDPANVIDLDELPDYHSERKHIHMPWQTATRTYI